MSLWRSDLIAGGAGFDRGLKRCKTAEGGLDVNTFLGIVCVLLSVGVGGISVIFPDKTGSGTGPGPGSSTAVGTSVDESHSKYLKRFLSLIFFLVFLLVCFLWVALRLQKTQIVLF